MREAEIDDALFGPETLGARVLGDEAAMAAVSRSNKADRRIFADLRRLEGSVRNERIILRGDHQERNADLSGHTLRADVVVIILGIAVAELRRSDDIIKLPDGSNRAEAVEFIALGKHFLFARVAGHQASDEVALIEIVFRALKRVGASGEIQGRAHCTDTAQCVRYSRGKLTRHFCDQISTHGIAGEEDALEAVAIGEFFEDRAVVTAHAGVVQSRRESFASTAVALVKAHDVKAALEGFLGDAPDVVRIAGTFETMHDNEDRSVFSLFRLPMAMAEQAGIRVHLKVSGFGRRNVEAARHKGGHDGHGVAVFEQGMGVEGRKVYLHMKTLLHLSKAGKSQLAFWVRRS